MPSAIIVFSHLRWDFVFQRPQQLMTRLAAHYPIIFIEEPSWHDGPAYLDTWSPSPGVLVCRPRTPLEVPGFHDAQMPQLRALLRPLLEDHCHCIAWFYTPEALPLLMELEPELVVYDCIDEAASLPHASRHVPQREAALLARADLVFSCGQGLHQGLSERHPNVHCIPGSVDKAHFVAALDRSNSHPAHRDIPGPRLGYYGVIDERFDGDLIGRVADAHPMWQIVLVGPVVGIDPGTLPQRANIHYLGRQTYDALPHFLAGWDVCILPYAMNAATLLRSPTKILEYMAAELPIVSTPVREVVERYADIVDIAADAAAFVAACESALLSSPEALARKVGKMRKVLTSTSWSATTAQVLRLLQSALRARQAQQRSAGEADAFAYRGNRISPYDSAPFVPAAVAGPGGSAGLSAMTAPAK